jgi:hypothetical protein
LKSSLHLSLIFGMLLFSMIACAGTVLTAGPIYICPTTVPPTPTMVFPTATGFFPTPSVTLAPTLTPFPTVEPTAYIIQAPADFYLNDAVFVGDVNASARVRFRLQNVQMYRGDSYSIYVWELEVKNAGSTNYEIFPSVQMVLSSVMTSKGEVSGTWTSTQAAADLVGLEVDDEVYTLLPDEISTYTFAALAPAGTPHRFTFVLASDGTTATNTMTWVNELNPYCSGDIADGV